MLDMQHSKGTDVCRIPDSRLQCVTEQVARYDSLTHRPCCSQGWRTSRQTQQAMYSAHNHTPEPTVPTTFTQPTLSTGSPLPAIAADGSTGQHNSQSTATDHPPPPNAPKHSIWQSQEHPTASCLPACLPAILPCPIASCTLQRTHVYMLPN